MLITYNKEKISKNDNNAFFAEYYDLFIDSSRISGLDWNYRIAPYLDRDLHEQLLNVTQADMLPIINVVPSILSLIRSGYFYTASLMVQQLDVSHSKKLINIKNWLLKSLIEADDTEE
jgi:hypothetical protein